MFKFMEKLDGRIETILELTFAVICLGTMYGGGAGFMTITALTV